MRLIGFVGRIVVLLVLVGIIGLAWLRWSSDRSPDGGGAGADVMAAATPELADSVEARFDTAVASGEGTVELTEAEFASLLLHALSGTLPGGIVPNSVRFVEGEVWIGGLVALSNVPSNEWLNRIRRVLPEEVPVEVRATVVSVEDGEAVLLIRRLSLAGIPLPRSAYAALLSNPGGDDGLPPEAVRVRLPSEVRSLQLDGDRLVVGVQE